MAATQTTVGLQKWTLDAIQGTWKRVYTLQAGLHLGEPYTVTGYPTGNNVATQLPWAPATDGLRNLTGVVNGNGTATCYAITSTVQTWPKQPLHQCGNNRLYPACLISMSNQAV